MTSRLRTTVPAWLATLLTILLIASGITAGATPAVAASAPALASSTAPEVGDAVTVTEGEATAPVPEAAESGGSEPGVTEPSQAEMPPALAASQPEVEPTVAAAQAAPTVTVTTAPYGGGQVTVAGSGFAAGHPGVYVGLAAAGGEGFYAVSRSLVDMVWVSTTNADGGPADARTGKMNPDGSFSVTFAVPGASPSIPQYAVYTSKAHGQGVADPSQNSTTAVAYAPAPAAPTITVSKATELNSEGELVTITGSGFVPDAPATSGSRPPLAGKFTGTYVVFGKFADAWKPSQGIPSSARKTGDTKWLVHAEQLATIGGEAAGGAVLAADGTFSVQLRVEKNLDGAPGNYGVYTYPGGGAKYAAFETFTPISFAPLATGLDFTTAPIDSVTEGGTVTLRAKLDSPVAGSVTFSSSGSTLGTVATDASGVATLAVSSLSAGTHSLKAVFAPTDTAAHSSSSATRTFTVVAKPVAIAAGSLSWGVKQSFRDYVTSPIAKGAISTSGARSVGGAFVFGQASGSTFNGATGTSAYSGSVRFTGHGGILDLRLANPVVRVESASSATLLLSVNGATVPFATLALASASKRTADGAVTFSGVPAALTPQGAAAFVNGESQFYPAGTALDPLTFTIGSPSASTGGAQTVAAFVAVANGVPPTPPASSGISLQGASADTLVEGDEVTITADGFKPNEQGIKVVIYSDPVILATDAAADASGVVTWTGRLPSGLTGEHTLTLQGSVVRGIVLTIADRAMMTTRTAGCVATDATITWGFKEAFRSYISGAIAHGEWTVADGATYDIPNFGWSGGTGSVDRESGQGLLAFTGSVTFTGHGGVLNTTISNPQLRFDDAESATLLLDVAGDTRDGVVVNQPAVEFATIDLGAAEVTADAGKHMITAAPAVLTPAGSAAFGTYEPGAELDPLAIGYTTDSDCAAAASTPTGEAEQPAKSATSPGWLVWGIIAAALAAVAAVAWVLVARRRSRA